MLSLNEKKEEKRLVFIERKAIINSAFHSHCKVFLRNNALLQRQTRRLVIGLVFIIPLEEYELIQSQFEYSPSSKHFI